MENVLFLTNTNWQSLGAYNRALNLRMFFEESTGSHLLITFS